MAATVQAGESAVSVNEFTPLVTFNERLNSTTTYTPDPEYQKSLKEIRCINLSEKPYHKTIDSFEKGRRNERRWAIVRSKRTNDYPLLLQQQDEIKSLKNEINLYKKITNFLIVSLAVTTVTSACFIYNCNSEQI